MDYECFDVEVSDKVAVRLADHGEKNSRAVIDHFLELPEIVDELSGSGGDDLFLHVAARDTDHLRELAMGKIGGRTEVADVRTVLVYEHHRRPTFPDLLD